jgi:hypothetical protein
LYSISANNPPTTANLSDFPIDFHFSGAILADMNHTVLQGAAPAQESLFSSAETDLWGTPHRGETTKNQPYKVVDGVVDGNPASGGISVSCAACGIPYTITRRRHISEQHLCTSCRGRAGVAAAMTTFVTPESTPAQRIRAQGLVNKRRRLGWFEVPKACAICGKEKRLSAHHTDYDRPDEVIYVCYSDHQRLHHNPSLADGIPVMKLDRQGPPPPRHSKGGRRGPTGKAIGRAPLITVQHTTYHGDQAIEYLACGHEFHRPADKPKSKQRRCQKCPRLPVPAHRLLPSPHQPREEVGRC